MTHGAVVAEERLESVVSNFSGLVRHDWMEGREYLVAPMVMIVEGVLNGSGGPLLYPKEELAKYPASWNHKPVVVYHPQINGVGVSACDPDILTNHKIGYIMNTRFEDGKLKAEAWLDRDRIDNVDPRIADAIERQTMMEVSTGLFVDVEPAEGEFRGKQYVGIARNYRPDHLALLPDKRGACSIEDGAGFLRMNAEWTTKYVNDLPDSAFLYIEPGGKKDAEGKTVPRSLRHLPYKDKNGNIDLPHLRNAIARIPQMKGISEDLKRSLQARARRLLEKARKGGLAGQELYEALGDAVRDRVGAGAFVIHATDDEVIFDDGTGGLFCLSYLVDDGGLEVYGKPERVRRHFSYVTVNGERRIDEVSYCRESVMNEKIEKLLKTGVWLEEDRAFLESLKPEALETLEKVTQRVKESVVKNVQQTDADAETAKDKKAESEAEQETKQESTPEAESKPATLEEYIEAAPAEIREVLLQGVRLHQRRRQELIDRIMANKRNVLSKEALEKKSFEDLEALAALAEPMRNDYSGLGPVEPDAGEEPLPLPVMTFGEKSE